MKYNTPSRGELSNTFCCISPSHWQISKVIKISGRHMSTCPSGFINYSYFYMHYCHCLKYKVKKKKKQLLGKFLSYYYNMNLKIKYGSFNKAFLFLLIYYYPICFLIHGMDEGAI